MQDELLLDQLTSDLTSLAQRGDLDVVIGRDGEINELIELLSGNQHRHVVVVSNAINDRTTIVEGLSLRITNGTVPEALICKSVRQLDLGVLLHKSWHSGVDELIMRLGTALSLSESILFIDELNLFVGSEANRFAPNLQRLLTLPEDQNYFPCISGMNASEFAVWQVMNAQLSQLFQPLYLSESL